MNDIEEQKQLLDDTLHLGISYQLLLLFVEQAYVFEKAETIKELGDVFKRFMDALSEEEKRIFKEKMDAMLEKTGEQMAADLSKQYPPEEINGIKKELEAL